MQEHDNNLYRCKDCFRWFVNLPGFVRHKMTHLEGEKPIFEDYYALAVTAQEVYLNSLRLRIAQIEGQGSSGSTSEEIVDPGPRTAIVGLEQSSTKRISEVVKNQNNVFAAINDAISPAAIDTILLVSHPKITETTKGSTESLSKKNSSGSQDLNEAKEKVDIKRKLECTPVSRGRPSLNCAFCQVDLENPADPKRQMEGLIPASCLDCKASFSNLKILIRNCYREKRYACSLCMKLYLTKSSVIKHFRVHTKMHCWTLTKQKLRKFDLDSDHSKDLLPLTEANSILSTANELKTSRAPSSSNFAS